MSGTEIGPWVVPGCGGCVGYQHVRRRAARGRIKPFYAAQDSIFPRVLPAYLISRAACCRR
eukprot:1270052-Rhodomonas_salina.3